MKCYALRDDQWEKNRAVTAREKRRSWPGDKSKGGLSTKIHATCDALGNPTSFYLTTGQAHDLDGVLLADKAYDADARVRDKLEDRDILAVIPSKANRKEPIEYDKHFIQSTASY